MLFIFKEIFIDGLKELIRLDIDWIFIKLDSVLYIWFIYFVIDEFVGFKFVNSYKFIILFFFIGIFYLVLVKLIVIDKYVWVFEGGIGVVKCVGNYVGSFLVDKEVKE